MDTESEEELSRETREERDKEKMMEEDSSFESLHSTSMKRKAPCTKRRVKTQRELKTNICKVEYEEEPKVIYKKKKYPQKYSPKFEKDPVLSGWIKPSSRGSYFAYCEPCGVHLKVTAGRADLRKHVAMKKHKANVESPQASQGDHCITAYVLGEDQPIATVELPLSNQDSEEGTKKRYYQRYSHSFERDPSLQGWVTSSPKGEYFARCIPCDIDLKIASGRTDLKRHAKNKKHIIAVAEYEQKLLSGEQYSMSSVDAPVNTVCIKTSTEDLEEYPVTFEINSPTKSPAKFRHKEVSSLLPSRLHNPELQIASFIAKYGLSEDISDHLIQLIKSVCPDSSIAQNMNCRGSDMIALTNDVLGKDGFQGLLQLLRDHKFSLIVDESTDRGSEKHLSMVVRVLNKYSIVDAFLGLIPMDDATPASLHSDIVEFFQENLIPYKQNMIGMAADGGNTVLGESNSLLSLMKEDVRDLFILRCIPHSFSLCASSACLKLPYLLEDLVRDVYSYFHFTPNYIELEEFEAFTSIKPHEVLHSAHSRWLSVHALVSKMVEKYEVLRLHFIKAAQMDNLLAPQKILQSLNKPLTKLYLMFLDFALPIFDNLDRHMQGETTQIHILHSAVGTALKAIYECYIDDTYLDSIPLSDIDYKDEIHFKPLEDVYLGIKVQMGIATPLLQHSDLREFRVNCLEFLMEGVCQIHKRYPYGSNVLESLETVNPKVVIERNVTSLINLIINFEHLATPDIQVVDNEWRLLRNMLNIITVNSGMRPEDFWNVVSKVRQIDHVLMCPNLSEFMFRLLCLPSSTLGVANIFSEINKMKTKSENISMESLMNILYTNQVERCKS